MARVVPKRAMISLAYTDPKIFVYSLKTGGVSIPQTREHSKRKWREVAEILNAQGDGVHKDWKSVTKYWVDCKAKLKRVEAALRLSQRRTGGGPSTEQPLSDIENMFLTILGEDYGQELSGIQVEPFPVRDN
ncbi:unnamed protein product [Euphydryas editha]|uniref:Regulatory protein zeste n=1 Tax=Euphydryas editha TaxID=104508 RepID=A0AAU9UVV1_EUPED|nr:unnamed protein product [Euphydryas editha]